MTLPAKSVLHFVRFSDTFGSRSLESLILWFVFLSVQTYGFVPAKEQKDPEMKFMKEKISESLVLVFSCHLTWLLISIKGACLQQKCRSLMVTVSVIDSDSRSISIGLSTVFPVSDRHGSPQTVVQTVLGKNHYAKHYQKVFTGGCA